MAERLISPQDEEPQSADEGRHLSINARLPGLGELSDRLQRRVIDALSRIGLRDISIGESPDQVITVVEPGEPQLALSDAAHREKDLELLADTVRPKK
ncbi:hypothetical protein COU91_00250 [Candidatus Saccharibacteria bacterium CG10_big_fil_rev_8_21_14_0_10_47_8]|nr:MAG: hypothetical protein COU91_00250 [Candidatus Saccharibacteria bacterium CG10_big_fil_rev_8_21_14_0_10_47_8]